MADVGMDVVTRRKKRPTGRWMPGERTQRILGWIRQGAALGGQMGGSFLMGFADVMGIPSGLQAAWLTALAAAGESLLWPMCGCALSFVMRLIWGLPPRWEMLATWAFLLLAPRLTFHKGSFRVLLVTAAALMPGVLTAAFTGTTADVLLACASVAVSALSAPVLFRGWSALREGRHIGTLEERVSTGYLAAMLLCGGGRMVLFGMNVGALGASALTLCMALFLGASAGTLAGLLGGLTLAMQGLPITLSVALAMGGFLAGMVQVREKRWLTCACFVLGTVLTMLLSGSAALGNACAATVAAAVLAAVTPATADSLRALFGRFLTADRAGGDAYAAAALASWERTVDAMARAVPSPAGMNAPHTGTYWQERLCTGCPDNGVCQAMTSSAALRQAESVWAVRQTDGDAWQQALEGLRGLGCARLYHLREAMTALAQQSGREEQLVRRACYERDMLTTHLAAMAGAARRFALLSSGATWWDESTGRALRQAASEIAFPATLLYARRIQGHAQAAWELHHPVPGSDLPGEICRLTADTLNVPMAVSRAEDDRVYLAECPLFCVEHGMAASAVTEEQNGDTVCIGALADGRFLTALSDGMGHGEQAGEASRKTTTLLRLCLDAGYTRTQTLTAVNGMMLSATRGERFATVDLLTIDLWNGNAALDKLGAAGSWLYRGGELTLLTGDALPLGILEQVTSHACLLRLRDGDRLVLMSDGVEDAFDSEDALCHAVRDALAEPSAQTAAENLLEAARKQQHPDDQTCVVLYFRRDEPRRRS